MVPSGAKRTSHSLVVPPIESYAAFALEADGKEMSTTMAVVRLITNLLRDKTSAPRIVPIVADEARTFGMANLFRQIGIYSPVGQLYTPEDDASMLSYRESETVSFSRRVSPRQARSRRGSQRRPRTAYMASRMLPFYIYLLHVWISARW